MALQDLTPQLRTRLSRVERVVGLFVIFSALLMAAGFAYYLYHTAERKGWFLNKVPYHTVVLDAAGLKVGDPVKLMGFDAGEIVEITPMAPEDYYNVYVKFLIRSPHYGYLWKNSKVKIAASDFLGKRYLEVTKGTNGPASVKEVNGVIIGILDDKSDSDKPKYLPIAKNSKGYFLPPEEAPALTERLDALVKQVEDALPGVFALTNQLTSALTNAVATLTNVNTTLDTVDTNLTSLVAELNRALDGLAGITSNLNVQVQANTNLVKEISDAIVHADDLMQGLKRHWFLRGAFREKKTNAPLEGTGKGPQFRHRGGKE